ncbi:MAG: hypothetical protein AMK73_04230 [Planctomycetes bacterium SM23_32]|nr:MAG: hypothetical protein AMK73_04230 [Planctomycetes bacterium SM23_32]
MLAEPHGRPYEPFGNGVTTDGMAEATTTQGPLFYVEVRGEELAGRQYDVDADGLLVGRSSSCDVILQDREVSRRHCYFYPDGPFCYVKDLGSKNGIFVNGRTERQLRLQDGAVVDVGSTRFVFHIEGAPPESAERPDPYAGLEEASRRHAPTTPVRHPLALSSLVFGLLACLHWAFGLGAVVLALLALYEMRGQRDAMGMGLVRGGLIVGLVGAALNGWFAAAAPGLRADREQAARLACRDNLRRVAAALESYAQAHGGTRPPGLGDLVAAGLLEPGHINCPGCRLEGAASCPYVYLGGERELSGLALGILACDSGLENHRGQGGWVLRGNGQLEWLLPGQLAQLLEQLAEADRAFAGAEP